MSKYFEIGYAAAAKRLCFFTGTGFSKALSDNAAPGWRELLEKICDLHIPSPSFKSELFPNSGQTQLQLDEAAQVIEIELSKSGKSIHQEVAEIISSIEPSGAFPETKKFLKKKHFTIVTTNYDLLAEKIAGGKCQSLTPGRPIPRSNSRVKAFHIHGSVEVPKRMVVTANDYFNFMNTGSYFSKKLSTVLHEYTVVILGYSLGDTNLKAILSDYRNFARNHVVSNSIFFVSRNQLNEKVVAYYENCYGIRVIQKTEIEEFFKNLNPKIKEAEDRLKKTLKNVRRVQEDGAKFRERYLQVTDSFYEFVSAIGARGASIQEDNIVNAFADIIKKKMEMTRKDSAWYQYEQLALWLTYLGSLIDVGETSLEDIYLKAVKFSMEHMSEKEWGYSWHAYNVWNEGWLSLTTGNRALVTKHIKEGSSNSSALNIVSRN